MSTLFNCQKPIYFKSFILVSFIQAIKFSFCLHSVES